MVESSSISLDKSLLERWKNSNYSADQQIKDLKALHTLYSSRFSFPELEGELKQSLVLHICTTFNESDKEINELAILLLGLVRILARDKARSDLACFGPLTSVLIRKAGLLPLAEPQFNRELLLEAEKCLINILFNAHKARAVFEKDGLVHLVSRISALNNYIQSSEESALAQFPYVKHLEEHDLKDLLFFDLKIAFVTSAQMSSIQEKWAADSDTTATFLQAVQQAVNNILLTSIQQPQNEYSAVECHICSEALKVLFNVYCHAKLLDVEMAAQCTQQCMSIVQMPDVEWLFEVKQNAVNLMALTVSTYLADPATAPLVAPKLSPTESGRKDEVLEGCDMHFVACLLTLFQQAIDKFGQGREVELLGTFLTVLIHVCTRNKQARRYCRLCVLPPLTAKEVEHAPESGATLRNKLVRLIQQANASNCHQLAAEFLFVLCKRSVNRLIKYCGFGHSAGLLANYGFLGAATNMVKSNSDSEDSETEDYKDVEHRVNPVTGYIPSESREEQLKRAFESMSEEQKEYEAMKLVDAINKLMDEGVMAPATLGPDGRPQKVEHIAELVKDVQLEREREDSD
uniref:Synembryn-A n=1 Tax=Ditylenchus dipsaci TaxID=166011 RepID=A0A915DXK4_9BILA